MAWPGADDNQSLVYNLTKLEINTIIKDNLTARKLPDPANAILDIALTYAWKLSDKGFSLDPWFRLARDAATRRDEERGLSAAGGETTSVFQQLEALNETFERQALASRGAEEPEPRQPPENLEAREVRGALPEPEPEPVGFDERNITVDAATFIALRWAAWVVGRQPSIKPAERVILDRIRKNCDQMKGLILRLYGKPGFEAVRGQSRATLNRIDIGEAAHSRVVLEMEPADMTTLRKIWEIGVQEVVAQTVIDLDGDTITYITRRYTAPSWGHILDVHRLGVQSAVGYWGNLIHALQRFLSDLLGLIGGRRNDV